MFKLLYKTPMKSRNVTQIRRRDMCYLV